MLQVVYHTDSPASALTQALVSNVATLLNDLEVYVFEERDGDGDGVPADIVLSAELFVWEEVRTRPGSQVRLLGRITDRGPAGPIRLVLENLQHPSAAPVHGIFNIAEVAAGFFSRWLMDEWMRAGAVTPAPSASAAVNGGGAADKSRGAPSAGAAGPASTPPRT